LPRSGVEINQNHFIFRRLGSIAIGWTTIERIEAWLRLSMENDTELLKAARTKDKKEALEKIFDLYSSALTKYALRWGCDPLLADQIVGDVFVKLMEQLDLGKGPETNLRSYLYQITYHQIIDQGRASHKSAPLEAADGVRQEEDSPALRLENQEMFDLILKAIDDELTDDQRQVILLRFIEEFSLQETADIMGKKVNHVKVIQSRAIAKLRKVM
jgi:RNA polymerase sigma-70 factor (ECF subfamily)